MVRTDGLDDIGTGYTPKYFLRVRLRLIPRGGLSNGNLNIEGSEGDKDLGKLKLNFHMSASITIRSLRIEG